MQDWIAKPMAKVDIHPLRFGGETLTKRRSEWHSSFIRSRKNFSAWRTSRECQSRSRLCRGWGQKEGRDSSWSTWKREATFGTKDGSSRKTTLSLWKVQKSRRQDRAPSSKILLAEVIATRKIVFRCTHFSPTSRNGLKGGFIRARRTTLKFHVGNLCFWGRLLAAARFRNFPTRGCLGKVTSRCAERTESRAATCHLRVAGFSPLSRPSCRNSRINQWSADSGSVLRLMHQLWNTFQAWL